MEPVVHALVLNLCLAGFLSAFGFAIFWFGYRSKSGLPGIGICLIGIYFLWLAAKWNLGPLRLGDATFVHLAWIWQPLAYGVPVLVWGMLYLTCSGNKKASTAG